MCQNNEAEALLLAHDVKPTAVRVLVLRALQASPYALSLSELEGRLGTVDKSSISRTLSLFFERHLVHSIDDGEGIVKYATCAEHCHCHDDDGFSDLHLHFTCLRCHRTYCLRGLPLPPVTIPQGFEVTTAEYMLKGICDACGGKRFP